MNAKSAGASSESLKWGGVGWGRRGREEGGTIPDVHLLSDNYLAMEN